jgi:signal transduction histidine kinase
MVGAAGAAHIGLRRASRTSRDVGPAADDGVARPVYGDVMRLDARLVDACIAAAVAAAMALIISVAQEPASRAPDALAYLLGVTVGALLLARREAPMLVLTGSVFALMTYYALDYPAFPPAVPLAVAAYSAAAAGRAVPAAVIVMGLQAFTLGWMSIHDLQSFASVLGRQTLVETALLAAVLLLGDAVRSRRERLRAVEEARELEAARRLEAQRLRIARELHDVMAHTVAGISVQAGVAADIIDEAPEQARAALRAMRRQTREAMDEIAATVGLLRGAEDGAPRVPAPGLAQLDGLVRMAGTAGVDVTVSVGGAPRALPAAVDLTAYRIVQESLTNVVRHAGATAARVRIDYAGDGVHMEVRDDGRGQAGRPATGHGLRGMHERAAALGGDLDAGPVAGRGFRVRARLPTRPTAP